MTDKYYFSPMKKKHYCESEDLKCCSCGEPIKIISILLIDWDKRKSVMRHHCNKCATVLRTKGIISEAKLVLINQPLPIDAIPIFIRPPNLGSKCDVFEATKLHSITTQDRAKVSKTQYIQNRLQFESDQEKLRLQKQADKRLEGSVEDISTYLSEIQNALPSGSVKLLK